MNIYIHVEIIERELDSKLLLALCAAARGHDVVVCRHATIRYMVNENKGLFAPGIFHAKDITPRKAKLARHDKLKKKGFFITSMDEEGGLLLWDYEFFAKSRLSEKSLEQTSAVFCWGEHDYNELVKYYPKYKSHFFNTGSTRADLWKEAFYPFWGKPKGMPQKPYLLLSSNFSLINSHHHFWEVVSSQRNSGYFERYPELEKHRYFGIAEETKILFELKNAIEKLAVSLPEIDIVVRPHPAEHPDSWKHLLGDYDNIHVIRRGPITPWVNNSFAIIHNGCTTAMEATVSGKPVISFVPFTKTYEHVIPNSLGYKVKDSEELIQVVKKIRSGENKQFSDDVVLKKIRYTGSELAADRMVDIWEEIANSNFEIQNNWQRVKKALTHMKYKELFHRIFKKIRRKDNHEKYRYRFPPLQIKEVIRKVELLKECTGKGSGVQIQFLDDYTILFKKR